MKAVLIGLFALALFAPSASNAATYTVNTLLNMPDANVGDGICKSVGVGQCTLRAAIQESNAKPLFMDRIEFSVGPMEIIIETSPLPSLNGHVTIDGRTAPGYNLTATDVADAPPSIYIRGHSSLAATADGFRIAPSNRNYQISIYAIGITNFPDNGIEVVKDDVAALDANWIGVSRSGVSDPNGGAGIYLNRCNSCRVGQWIDKGHQVITGLGNVISNNGEDGVYVYLGEDNIIGSNLIGDDPVGSGHYGNGGHGINLAGGANHLIGEYLWLSATESLKTSNIITNNAGDGIYTLSGGHRIYTNRIFGNSGNGVTLNAANNYLGFVNPGMRNFIQGNGGHGVEIGKTVSSDGNTVQINAIYQNGSDGVHITSGSGNIVEQNDIADNDGNAVHIRASGNAVIGNNIGFFNGFVLGNSYNGIVLAADGTAVADNRIAAMDDDGIDVFSGDRNFISDNQIGTSNSGANWGNAAAGVRVRAAATDTWIDHNRIGRNKNGIVLEGGGTDVCGNRIGVGSNAELAGNLGEGIWVKGSGNRIGDLSVECSGNVIGDNVSDGIEIWGSANIIHDNQIGGIPGIDLGNHYGGILLTTAGASFNEIVGNTIVNNATDGVRVGSNSGTRNRVEKNVFEGNGDLGIDLNDDGITPNDAGDVDTGPNNVQNTPVIITLTGSTGELLVSYRIDSNLGASVYPLNADFYLSGSGGSYQGRYFLQRDVYNVAPNSVKTVTVTLPALLASGGLTSMAVDLEGNSSEFSAPMAFTVVPVTNEIFKDGFED